MSIVPTRGRDPKNLFSRIRPAELCLVSKCLYVNPITVVREDLKCSWDI
jgi:hypothetical protein